METRKQYLWGKKLQIDSTLIPYASSMCFRHKEKLIDLSFATLNLYQETHYDKQNNTIRRENILNIFYPFAKCSKMDRRIIFSFIMEEKSKFDVLNIEVCHCPILRSEIEAISNFK